MARAPHLLCATDLSQESGPAMEMGAWLAGRLGARVTLLSVVEPAEWQLLPPDIRHARYKNQVGHVERELKRLRESVFADVDCTAQVEEVTDRAIGAKGYPTVPDGIWQVAERCGATAIVMGTHGHSGLDRLLLGSVAEKVVRHAAIDVLTVKPRPQTDVPLVPVTRVLCGVDFSEPSAHALAHAASLCESLGAELHVAHAWTLKAQALPDFHVMRQEVEEARTQQLERAIAPHAGLDPTPHLVMGEPASALVAAAASIDAQLIVVGTLGRTGVARFLIGSVAERVVRMSDRPVLVVHVRP